MLAVILLLPACAVPDWIFDSGGQPSPLTPQAYTTLATVAATGTPIDAMESELPAASREALSLDSVVPYPEATPAAALVQEAGSETCSDANTANSLSYQQALPIAADSDCTASGDLLPAHFCNQNTGTWWISLSAPQEGCDPACVVDVNSHAAEINWRCSGAAIPAEDTPLPQASATEALDAGFAEFNAWQGIIHRQPHGSLVEYRFLRDDGQWFDIGSPENDIRQQFAIAAWTAAKVILSGEETAVPGLLNVEELLAQQTRSLEARDLTAFAMSSSSSQLTNDEGGSYYAWSAVDGLLAQPWCEGVDGPGKGEWLQLDFSAPLEITAIKLANGYQSEDYLFVLNNRVQTTSVLADDEWIAEWDLLDSRDWQAYTVAGDESQGVVASSLKLVIEETIDGWEFDDTCIAEVQVWGKPVP